METPWCHLVKVSIEYLLLNMRTIFSNNRFSFKALKEHLKLSRELEYLSRVFKKFGHVFVL